MTKPITLPKKGAQMATKKQLRPITIKQDDTAPEVLAKAIVDISTGVRKLLDGPLTRDALVLLINENMPVKDRVGKKQIASVLEAAAGLKRRVRK